MGSVIVRAVGLLNNCTEYLVDLMHSDTFARCPPPGLTFPPHDGEPTINAFFVV